MNFNGKKRGAARRASSGVDEACLGNPIATSYLTVYPGGTARPGASNLNFVAGQTIPNLVLVPLGPGGTVTFFNKAGTVNVLGDLVGYFKPAPARGSRARPRPGC